VTGARGAPPGARAAVLVGLATAFVVAVDLACALRPALLLDPERAWALARLLLGLGVAAAAGTAGAGAAALFFLGAGTASSRRPLEALPLSRRALAAIAIGAFLAGSFLRLAALDRVPVPLWVDDISLAEPTLALTGTWSDFADTIRPAPYGVSKPFGTVGVLYLEVRRAAFKLAGVGVLGVRLPAALAGCASLVTAGLLGRALLPAGGGALAMLVLAGMRWQLILSRWGWVAMFLAPIADVAALLLLSARRSRSAAAAAVAGLVAGLGAHVYLSAWVVAAALGLLALWPGAAGPWRSRARLAGAFAAGFVVAAAPLFLFRQNRATPYFSRLSDHSVAIEMERARSPRPLLEATADALKAPWFLTDPVPINDIPGRARLGWILGVPVALALARSLRRPAEEISAFLLAHAACALAASVASGQAHSPNGFRFGYLTSVTAVAAAAGTLGLARAVPAAHRRAAALVAVGALTVGGAIGAREALVDWGESMVTFDFFHGPDTLVGRAAARWERYGTVRTDLSLVHSPITFGAVRGLRLAPWRRPGIEPDLPPGRPTPAFRISGTGVPGREGDRVVERIGDGWGREWGVVIAHR